MNCTAISAVAHEVPKNKDADFAIIVIINGLIIGSYSILCYSLN